MKNINRLSSKKKAFLSLLTALAIIAGYTIISPSCGDPDHDHSSHDYPGDQVYTCSMHPQIRSTDPDEKCPICGMILVPVDNDGDEDGDQHPNTLRLSPRAVALAGIQTVPASQSRLAPSILLSGRIEYDETRLRTIAARVSGRIDRLRVDYTGAIVNRGTILAEIYSPALLAAQEELLQAASQAEQPGPEHLQKSFQNNFISAKEKLRLLGLSFNQIEEILARGKTVEHLLIEAPLTGVVIDLQVKQGVYVETGQSLYTLADLSRVWVQLEAYESDLAHIFTGQRVSVTVEGIPGRSFDAGVAFIDPVLDPLTRTSKVRVELPNSGGQLRPGMFVRGELSGAARTGITVPASAPLITGRRALVYVRLPGDTPRFEAREVTLGPRVNDSYIVTGGLNEGDLVVVHGAFKIDSELQIRGRPSMMSPGGGAPPVHDHAAEISPPQTAGPQTAAKEKARETVLPSVDISPILDYYEKAWRALAADDLKGWQNAVESMQSKISETEWPSAYVTQRKGVLRGSGHIGHTGSIEEARALFETHSEALIPLLRAGLADKTWYILHCPMAFDFRGADWLQTEQEVSNPYFGAGMLRCGEVTETLHGKGGK